MTLNDRGATRSMDDYRAYNGMQLWDPVLGFSSQDDERVATAGADSKARLWAADSLRIAVTYKLRELTPEERERFEIPR